MKTNEKTIGKGLAIILGDDLDYKAQKLQNNSENSILVPTSKLVLNPYIEFEPDAKAIDKLAIEIKENGQLTPILVRKKDDYYEVVTGEKRYYACKKIGLDKIKVVVCDFNDHEVQDLYMYDLFNKNRLNLVAEAKLYKSIIENKNINQSELARRLNKSRSSISNSLRLLTLNQEVLDLIVKYKLTLGQIKPLIGLQSDFIVATIYRIVNENLASRDIERVAQGEKNKNNFLTLINEKEKSLNKKYNCKVRIRGKKIEFNFKSSKELEDFISLINKF